MLKKALLAVTAYIALLGSAMAQQAHCYTDEVRARIINDHPEVVKVENALEQQIRENIKKLDFKKFAKTTDTTGGWIDVPIVVHVIHDYGVEYVSDDAIFKALDQWNQVYALQNTADTALVIAPFKKYIGNPKFRLHLATIDPYGQPTKGITRRRTNLTTLGGNYAKFDQWPNTAYVNIWVINSFDPSNYQAAAYALQPAGAAVEPFYDGIIVLYNYLANTTVAKTINHEMGHIFNLEHPWGNTNNPEVACGDDEVDDTPPTRGHSEEGCQYNSTALYDTVCAKGYFKVYPSVQYPGLDSLVDYPDTVNAQNIMDYTYCAKMFTIGQVERMHAAAMSNIAGRNNLWNDTNLVVTGVYNTDGSLVPRPDLPIIPDFSISNAQAFSPIGTSVVFTNRSWNDTIASAQWSFTNGATSSSSSSTTTVNNTFTQSGWVTTSLAATGNNTAQQTVTKSNLLYIADTTGTNFEGYFQEFNADNDLAKWPIINYYNNGFNWQLANVGYYDNTSLEFTGYDSRIFPDNLTGLPWGGYSDFFSIPFDLTAYSGNSANLNFNFMYSGASRTANSADLNDKLEIDYSKDGITWVAMDTLKKARLDNMGPVATAYSPTSISDWAPYSVNIPAVARTSHTYFRLRYKSGLNSNAYVVGGGENLYSTSNNLYIDRINISPYAEAVANVNVENNSIAVVPNPTNGDAYVVIKDVTANNAEILVTDITGKLIYKTQHEINGTTRIQIPQAYLTVKGIYLVQVITGNQTHTEKLVVY